MLDGSTIRAVNAWCQGRALSWSAADRAGANAVVMLRPVGLSRPWRRMMLVWDGEELRLENEMGETLASASDLPALLDAVDGGVGEAAPLSVGPLAGLLAGHAAGHMMI